MRLHDLAFVRSGDKGDISNVAVLARDEESYRQLERLLLPEAIKSYMGPLVTGPVAVYRLPRLQALNVVMHGALGGGATTTLRFDETGKSMGAVLSRMELTGDDGVNVR
ncbi:hypothetical protein HJD18_16565 [Thermoleophilia bacterium SCSIO 60948]|nr:hypothetical protein HJD18_16565 [Thermoleophilia bacterium SCSIO 60948]